MRRIAIFTLLIVVCAFRAAAQESVEIRILRDKDSFTLFLPNGGSLGNFALEMTPDRQGKSLGEYPALANVTLENLGPACIRFERASRPSSFPSECAGALLYAQQIADDDLFWFDDGTHQPRPVPIFSGGRVVDVCPGRNATCEISFTPQTASESAACANIADIDHYEVLVLVSNFETNRSYTTIRWLEILGEAITPDMNVRVQPLSQIVRGSDEARELIECYQATLVIWGKISLEGVESHFSAKSWWGDVDALPPTTPKQLTVGVIPEVTILRPLTSDTAYLTDFARANLLYYGEDTENALPVLAQAIESAPKGVPRESGITALYFYQGYIQWAMLDEADAAADSFGSAIFFDPTTPYAAKIYYRRGKAYIDAGQYGLAITDFTQAITLQPDFARAYVNRGVAYYHLGLYEEAWQDYNQAISLDPDNAVAYNNRGLIYAVRGDYQNALADYTHAIDLAPDYAEAYFNRGTVYQIQEDSERAEADFQQATLLASGDLAGLINQGIAAFDQGDYAGAIEIYTQAIDSSPEFALAYYNRANAYYAQGDFEQAGLDYQQAVDLNPSYPNAYDGLGNIHTQNGDDEAAAAAYSQAIELDPNNPEYYVQRGLSFFHQSDYDRAIDDYSQAIALQPDHIEAYKLRAAAYTLSGNLDDALADYSDLIDIRPDADSFSSRGAFFVSEGDFESAIDDFTEVIDQTPDKAEAYYNRANAYTLLGEYALAIEDFEAAIRLNPDYSEAIKGRESIYSLQGSTPLESTPELAD